MLGDSRKFERRKRKRALQGQESERGRVQKGEESNDSEFVRDTKKFILVTRAYADKYGEDELIKILQGILLRISD